MPTNANTFNSRVTSEALEAKFRQVFPSQGGAELPQDLFASGVLQPVIDFTTVAEGSVLAPNLQTAWDFSTTHFQVNNTTQTLITNTGFWQVDLTYTDNGAASTGRTSVVIDDGTSSRLIWGIYSTDNREFITDGAFVVFLRSGDSLKATAGATDYVNIWFRQIADVNGNLVNPLGFTFS